MATALATDYFHLRDQFSEDELERFLATRRFVDEEVLPQINAYWEAAELPWPLMRRLAELGLFAPMSPLAHGLVHMELHRGDGSLGTFYGVQAGLAMKSIELLGSDEQQARWLPRLASLDAIGAFALTEPDHGSDSVALETTATRDGDDLRDQRRQALDRQRLDRRRHGRLGPRHRRRAGQGLPGRDRPARLPGDDDDRQGRRPRDLAGRHRARRRRRRAPAGNELLQGRRPRARHHPRHLRLGRARPRRRQLRRRAHLHEQPNPVRQAADVASSSCRTGS